MVTKVSIINAYGVANRGDAVLLTRSIVEIESVYERPEISVFLFDKVGFDIPGVNLLERLGGGRVIGVMARLCQILFLLFSLLSLVSFAKFTLRFLSDDQKASLKVIEFCDVVVSAPGGYIQDSNFSYLMALANINFACCIGKPVILANQSIGPLRSSAAKYLSSYILNRCKKIIVRENFSCDFCLNELNLDKKIVVRGGDLAFWDVNTNKSQGLNNLAKIGIGEREEFMGMTVLEWNFPGFEDSAQRRSIYIERMCQIIRYVNEKYSMRTVLFNQVSDDKKILGEIVDLTSGLVVTDDEFVEEDVFRGMLSFSKFFVGSRFHSCVFSMMETVPVMAISYLPKTEYIMKDLGLDGYYFDINKLDFSEMAVLVDKLHNDNVQVRDEVGKAVSGYREKFANLAEVLKSVERM